MGHDAIFYHIYPLGFCDAPEENDFGSVPVPRLSQIGEWIPHLCSLGVNALYLGPLFESSRHGYDTADYYHVDHRLGTRQTLVDLVRACHDRGIRVIVDGVFNHVGRDFWAFRDLLERGDRSPYKDWFQQVRFDGASPYGDPFTYQAWEGHYELVQLDLCHPEVRQHLFQAVDMWIDELGIDGLRLDVAYCLDPSFTRDLCALCRERRPGFWLMGEVIHGDYRQWVREGMLDSVTNYECYKGLYSSHNDRNYFEIAYALERQFGSKGLYRGVPLYAFCDNHDVDRVASRLTNPAHLYPLYALLFSMPGIPAIYYGSEWGIAGRKEKGSDAVLRPHLDRDALSRNSPHPNLCSAISRLASLRRSSSALRHGDYEPLLVQREQLAFCRRTDQECVICVFNASDEPVSLDLPVSWPNAHRLVDLLNGGRAFPVVNGRARVDPVWPNWARLLFVR